MTRVLIERGPVDIAAKGGLPAECVALVAYSSQNVKEQHVSLQLVEVCAERVSTAASGIPADLPSIALTNYDP